LPILKLSFVCGVAAIGYHCGANPRQVIQKALKYLYLVKTSLPFKLYKR
jgi:hypothetical protein